MSYLSAQSTVSLYRHFHLSFCLEFCLSVFSLSLCVFPPFYLLSLSLSFTRTLSVPSLHIFVFSYICPFISMSPSLYLLHPCQYLYLSHSESAHFSFFHLCVLGFSSSLCLFVWYLFICLHLCLFTSLSVYLFVCLSVCLSACLLVFFFFLFIFCL